MTTPEDELKEKSMTPTNIKRQIAEVKVPEHPLPKWAKDILNEVKTMTTPEDTELQRLLDFLCGEKDFDGQWFGSENPNKPLYWWRSELKKAITLHTQKAGQTVHTDFYDAERLAKIDELLRAQENIGYVQLTPEDKKSGTTRAGKYLIKRLEYLTNPTERKA